jgi:dolichol-phosphate mannosyltransferase
LGMVSKYTIALLGPAALLFVIVDPSARRWLRRPEPYLAAILALILFSPVIYWNAIHGWASFAFQSTHRLQEEAAFSTPTLITSAAVLLTPLGLISVIAVFVSGRIRDLLAPGGDTDARRRLLFMLIFTAIPLFVFVVFSLRHQVKFDWTAPIWLAILPAVSAMIVRSASSLSRYDRAIRKLWVPTLVGTLAIYSILLHYMVLGLPFVGHFENIRTLPVAWNELGRQAGAIQRAIEMETGGSVLIAGMDKYYVASEVAFYNNQPGTVQTSVGGGPLGNDSLMYDYWFKPSDMQGRTFLLLAVKRSEVEQEDLPRYFSRLTDIKAQTVSKNGSSVGQFFYRVGYDYRDCSLPQNSCPAK